MTKAQNTIHEIETVPWKLRTNDFYSRVPMHPKNERASAATRELFDAL